MRNANRGLPGLFLGGVFSVVGGLVAWNAPEYAAVTAYLLELGTVLILAGALLTGCGWIAAALRSERGASPPEAAPPDVE